MTPSWAFGFGVTLRKSVEEKAKCQEEFSKPRGSVGTRSWRPSTIQLFPTMAPSQAPHDWRGTGAQVISNFKYNPKLFSLRSGFVFDQTVWIDSANVWLIHKPANQIKGALWEDSIQAEVESWPAFPLIFPVSTLSCSFFYPSLREVKLINPWRDCLFSLN